MARKLRIYTGERHDFEGHPQLQAFTMPPRKLRVKGELFELPPGFEPFNPQAYYVSGLLQGRGRLLDGSAQGTALAARAVGAAPACC